MSVNYCLVCTLHALFFLRFFYLSWGCLAILVSCLLRCQGLLRISVLLFVTSSHTTHNFKSWINCFVKTSSFMTKYPHSGLISPSQHMLCHIPPLYIMYMWHTRHMCIPLPIGRPHKTRITSLTRSGRPASDSGVCMPKRWHEWFVVG